MVMKMNEEWRNELVTKGAVFDAQEVYMAIRPLDGYEDGLAMLDILRNLPSAQPQSTMGQPTDAVQSTKDCISRQVAIDALGEKPLVWDDLSDFDLGKAAQWSDDVDAIKNLQPTCNQLATDCISRQDAIDVINAVFPVDSMKSEYAQGITCGAALAKTYVEQLPSAQPEQRWIPVTEDTPKKRDWYLGIFKEPDTGWINPLPFICDYVGKETKITTKGCWILKGYTDREEHIDYYFDLECVAWMPLPEPWRGEQNGKNS